MLLRSLDDQMELEEKKECQEDKGAEHPVETNDAPNNLDAGTFETLSTEPADDRHLQRDAVEAQPSLASNPNGAAIEDTRTETEVDGNLQSDAVGVPQPSTESADSETVEDVQVKVVDDDYHSKVEHVEFQSVAGASDPDFEVSKIGEQDQPGLNSTVDSSIDTSIVASEASIEFEYATQLASNLTNGTSITDPVSLWGQDQDAEERDLVPDVRCVQKT